MRVLPLVLAGRGNVCSDIGESFSLMSVSRIDYLTVKTSISCSEMVRVRATHAGYDGADFAHAYSVLVSVVITH